MAALAKRRRMRNAWKTSIWGPPYHCRPSKRGIEQIPGQPTAVPMANDAGAYEATLREACTVVASPNHA